MLQYVGRRILATIPTLIGLSILVFSIVHLVPGDPIRALLAESGATAEVMEAIREQWGLNDPLPVQYIRWLSRAVRGDLGRSISYRRPVVEIILGQLPDTLRLAMAGMAVAIVVGGALGIASALKRDSWLDNLFMIIALVGISVPTFWSGLLAILIFAVTLHWLPITGAGGLKQLIMPAGILGLVASGTIARLMRSTTLEVLGADYIRTARAKGLPERMVILRHALRNALIPVITVVGLQLGTLMNGAVVLEMVFARPGIGSLAVLSILSKDIPVVQGTVLFGALIYVLVNMVVDILYTFVDPRIRYE